jgi:hypothetical protein
VRDESDALSNSRGGLPYLTLISSLLADDGALVVGPYVCPHRFAEPCPCKKPNERAAREHGIDQATSWVIRDSPDDVLAAPRLSGPYRTAGLSFFPLDTRRTKTQAPLSATRAKRSEPQCLGHYTGSTHDDGARLDVERRALVRSTGVTVAAPAQRGRKRDW